MALEIHYKDGLLRMVLSGRLTEADLMGMANAAEEIDGRETVSPDRIADGTAVAGIDITFNQMQMFASRRREARLKNKIRSAIVAPNPLHYGFARMYQTLNDNPDIRITVFKDSESAERWLTEKAPPEPPVEPVRAARPA